VIRTHRNPAVGGEEGSERPRQRQRLLVRGLMLLPIAGLVGALLLDLARRAARDRAIEGIRSVGGVYARDESQRDRPVVSVDLGAYLIDDTGKVHHRRQADNSQLALLACFPQLRDLSLEGSAVTDLGLAHLCGHKALRRLSLRGTLITDAGLIHLRALRGLTLLDLRDTRITAAGIAALRVSLPGAAILGNEE
jgi:hypothetical protein